MFRIHQNSPTTFLTTTTLPSHPTELIAIISTAGSFNDPSSRSRFQEVLLSYLEDECKDPSQDPLVKVGTTMYGAKLPSSTPPPSSSAPPAIISFEFMTAFMKDVFLSYGVPEKEATICADVLIEVRAKENNTRLRTSTSQQSPRIQHF